MQCGARVVPQEVTLHIDEPRCIATKDMLGSTSIATFYVEVEAVRVYKQAGTCQEVGLSPLCPLQFCGCQNGG